MYIIGMFMGIIPFGLLININKKLGYIGICIQIIGFVIAITCILIDIIKG